MRIAATIDVPSPSSPKSASGNEVLRHWFLANTPEAIWQSLVRGEKPEVKVLFDRFLDLYGFRCINELKLEENDLHDDPTFVVSSVQSYVRSGSYDIAKMEKR